MKVKPYRTEAFVSDFGVVPITPWMQARLGNKRLLTRLSSLIFSAYVGIAPPEAWKL